MVYPHSNDIGKEKPKPKPVENMWQGLNTLYTEIEPLKFDSLWQDVKEKKEIYSMLYGGNALSKSSYEEYLMQILGFKFEPPKPKTIQPDKPVYSQQAHALRIEVLVNGFALKNNRIGAQWMVSNEQLHKQGGLPVEQAEKMIDAMLADIKKNMMDQIKENAK